jgi:long-chain acyl-CoA synthetase
MKAKFTRLEDSQTLEIDFPKDKLKISPKKDRNIIALACLDYQKYIKNYIDIIKQEDIPLVLNPKIPTEVLNQIAISQQANTIIFNNESIKLESNEPTISPLGHILCSSGTTSKAGTPKKFFFPLLSPYENAKAHYESFNSTQIKNILFPLPFSHSFGIVVGVWGGLIMQAETYFYQEAFSVNNILNDIRDRNIDLLYLSPSLARQIIKFAKRYKQKIVSPKIISIGSSTFYQSEMLELGEIFPDTQFYYTYGLTEMGPRVSTYKVELSQLKNETISLPLGIPLRGIEWMTSKTLKIKSKYCEENLIDTYFDTQDSIFLKEDNIFINGRVDDVIIHQGINIFPNEVETLLLTHENVQDCALIAESSKLYGEVPVLIIKTDLSLEAVIGYLRQKLPPSHIPKKVYFDIEIPKTSLGKIQRELLKKIVSELT